MASLRRTLKVFALVVFALVVLAPASSRADAVLLLEEAYGRFGSLSPTGHAAVYLTRVCAATPIELRRCNAGETGVVIGRYHDVGGFDWIAVPLMPYLFAFDLASDIPGFANREGVANIRDTYRRAQLRHLVPDSHTAAPPKGRWTQLVGAAYDRSIVALGITTTPAQDDSMIRMLNDQQNTPRFNLLFQNCADFVRDIINTYYPGALGSNAIADLGITTPKQIAKGMVRLTERRPEVGLTAFVVPQIPGSRSASGKARGLMESLVKTKKYAIPLAIIQPWIPAGLAAGYLATGRFNPHRLADTAYQPQEVKQFAMRAATAP